MRKQKAEALALAQQAEALANGTIPRRKPTIQSQQSQNGQALVSVVDQLHPQPT